MNQWTTVPFDRAFKDVTSKGNKIPQDSFQRFGRFPIIDQGESFIAGYVDDESLPWNESLPVVIFGDHTRIVKFIDFPFVLGADGTKVLEPSKDVIPKFGYYSLLHLYIPSAGYSRHFRFLKESELSFPRTSEQKRIAAILDKADWVLRQRRSAQTLSDSFLQSVFIKMFGDPVSNPMSWETDSLDNLSQKITDGEHLNPNFTTEGYPMVMAQHVDNNSVNLKNCRFVSSEDYLKFSKKCHPERDDVLLVSRGATIGRTCVVDTDKKFCMMGSVILIKPKRKSVNADFINQLFKTPSYQKSLRRTSGSSAQEAIYIANLRNGEIIKPPLPLQETFAGIVKEHERICRQQHEAIRQAEHLFQTLLHRAFRGEL